jgi:hypothetical protein
VTDLGYDSQGNSLGDETILTTWSISEGAGGNWSSNVYTSQFAGSWTVIANIGTVQGTALLTVLGSAPVSIVAYLNNNNVTAGSTVTGTCYAFDQEGNNLGSVTASWSVQAGEGSSFNGNSLVAGHVGTWVVTATCFGLQDSVNLTVNAGNLDHITISMNPANIKAGYTSTGTATAYDNQNNYLGTVSASSSWSIQSGASGSWSGNVYTSSKAGTWIVTALFSGKQATCTLTVNSTLSNLTVSLSSNPANIGLPGYPNLITCTATVDGSDATGTITWTSNSTTGVFNSTSSTLTSGFSSVTYYDTVVGNVTITASYSGDSSNLPSNATASLSLYPMGDINFDGKVNFRDLTAFVAAYIQFQDLGVYNPACDFNHDGRIDFLDLRLFVEGYIVYNG